MSVKGGVRPWTSGLRLNARRNFPPAGSPGRDGDCYREAQSRNRIWACSPRRTGEAERSHSITDTTIPVSRRMTLNTIDETLARKARTPPSHGRRAQRARDTAAAWRRETRGYATGRRRRARSRVSYRREGEVSFCMEIKG